MPRPKAFDSAQRVCRKSPARWQMKRKTCLVCSGKRRAQCANWNGWRKPHNGTGCCANMLIRPTRRLEALRHGPPTRRRPRRQSTTGPGPREIKPGKMVRSSHLLICTMTTDKKRILVVDDEPSDTQLLRRYLEGTELYVVREVNDPLSALSAAEQFEPELILLD